MRAICVSTWHRRCGGSSCREVATLLDAAPVGIVIMDNPGSHKGKAIRAAQAKLRLPRKVALRSA